MQNFSKKMSFIKLKKKLTFLPQRIETAYKDVMKSLKQCSILNLMILNMKGPEFVTFDQQPEFESEDDDLY